MELTKQGAIEEFNPTENQLLCDVVEESSKTESGLIIPDSVRIPLQQGVVLKAGNLCDQELYCKGRVIIFRLHTEAKVTIAGENYLLVEPVNVLLTGPVLKEGEKELGD